MSHVQIFVVSSSLQELNVYLQSDYKNKFCVHEHLGVRFHLTTLSKILETCPSSSHAKQLMEAMQQNKTPEKIT